jgi:hypothetical protein
MDSTSGILQQIAGYSSGRTDKPIIQRDALIDARCLGLYDFGRKWGYLAQASPIAAGTAIRSYKRGGNTATVAGAPAFTGGMMLLSNVAQTVPLPAEWRLPSTNTHFAIGGYLKIPKPGYPSGGTGTAYSAYIGWTATNGSNPQYNLRALYDAATGVLNNVYLSMNVSVIDITAATPNDRLAYHYAFEFVVVTSTTFQAKVYVDGALVFTSVAVAYSGALIVPSSGTPTLGIGAAGAIGRIWLWDLSATKSKTIGDLIAADIAANTSRFS